MDRLDSFPAQTAEMKVDRGPEIEVAHWRFQEPQAQESVPSVPSSLVAF